MDEKHRDGITAMRARAQTWAPSASQRHAAGRSDGTEGRRHPYAQDRRSASTT